MPAATAAKQVQTWLRGPFPLRPAFAVDRL